MRRHHGSHALELWQSWWLFSCSGPKATIWDDRHLIGQEP
jgi:hypothetical protein